MKNFVLLLLMLVSLTACDSLRRSSSLAPAAPPSLFGGELSDYWYEGEAELSTYTLEQARYGELRGGEVVLIQVTEDFLTDEQVKNDKYVNPNSASVLKTNMIRRFTTGIYDYSVMTSVFTPTDGRKHPRTLKVTTSEQDWCGQSFTQLNYLGNKEYRMQLRSYFEVEGDQNEQLAADFLEDEIFNRIRIAGTLPEGEFSVIPPTGYLLMTHQPYVATTASASMEEIGDDRLRYVLEYPSLQRKLEVTFDREPPYVIRGWTETYPSGGELLTTTATLQRQIMSPYWQLNGTKDTHLRRQLGL